MTGNEKVEAVRAKVTDALVELESLFVSEATLTFLMHVPGKPGREMLITRTEIDKLIGVLQGVKDLGNFSETLVCASTAQALGSKSVQTIPEKLEQLSKDWVVSLATLSESSWALELTEPRTLKGHRYEGTLESVVARSHAGEPGERTFTGEG